MSIEDFVIEHADWIRRKARRYYADRDDADDLASETIYKCLSQGSRFDCSKSFRPWALTIMENTYITQYNRRRCVLFTGYEEYGPYPANDYADQLAMVNRLSTIIEDCGRKTKNIDCVILYAEGYSYQEIADRLHIPIGTVRSRVSFGRKMLREAFDC